MAFDLVFVLAILNWLCGLNWIVRLSPHYNESLYELVCRGALIASLNRACLAYHVKSDQQRDEKDIN